MIERSIEGAILEAATAMVVALPLALTFGVSTGAGALATLYGAIFGGRKMRITGPTGAMTVVIVLNEFYLNS